MPTIEISLKTLEKLAKRKIALEELERVKAYPSLHGDRLRIELADTNRPDLWSAEGIARALREKGIPKTKVKKSSKRVIVHSSIKSIRPFIAAFAAKKIRITEELLEELISLQEMLAENFGKKRKKISIGIYNFDKINFPVHYKAVSPSLKFIPLEFKQPLTLKEILENHPKGAEYGYIVRNHRLYPIFTDSKEEVLSFPPVINSNYLGRVTTKTRNLFIEVTGTDLNAVNVVANILCYSLYDRNAAIEGIEIVYPWKTRYGMKISTPLLKTESVTFRKDEIEKVLGIRLNDSEIKELLESMQYNARIGKSDITVFVPSYRNDVMHFYDVIEDLAIAYGYGNFKSLELKSFTAGSLDSKTHFINKVRDVIVGLGFQEILSHVLINKDKLDKRMNISEKNMIEIENVMSEKYSAVRSWIIPSLMDFLSENLHNDYPQYIFEAGECAVISGNVTKTENKLGVCITDSKVGYENISTVLNAMMLSLGKDYKIEKSEFPGFIHGRAGKIIVNGRHIGTIGEVHPLVLNRWRLEKPVVAFEVNLDMLM